MAAPTAYEQEMLELINRARSDPQGEYLRMIGASGTGTTPDISNALKFFGVDVNLFKQQIASLPSVAPLAWSSPLNDAARGHSQQMIAADTQSHQVAGEPALGTRITNAGYDWNSIGENIYAFANGAFDAHAAFFIDWGGTTGGMQNPAGHRISIMNATYKEVGISAIAENNPATQVGSMVITEDFGSRFSYAPQVLGVVYNDLNSDKFYEAGEGLANVTVKLSGAGGTFTTSTFASGGYQVAAPNGTYTVTISGGSFQGTKTGTVTVAGSNVKFDAISGTGGTTPGTPTGAAFEAAVALTGYVMGKAPTEVEMNARATFAQTQLDYYTNVLKVLQPQLGPYEALGLAFSDLQPFQGRYGPALDQTTTAFVTHAYQEVFARAPTTAQSNAFKAQVDYFTNLYLSAGINANTALIHARGAVLGQMIGYVMTDAVEKAQPAHILDDQVATFLVGVNGGNTALYGSAWG